MPRTVRLVGPHTIYDIASITKIVTLTATLALASAGRLRLDDRLGDLLDCATFRNVTVRQVLAHTAGLRLSLSSLQDRPRPEIEAAILAAGPVTEPGARFYYSSQGYYLLGKALEAVSGQQLADCLRTTVLDPLGMSVPPPLTLPRRGGSALRRPKTIPGGAAWCAACRTTRARSPSAGSPVTPGYSRPLRTCSNSVACGCTRARLAGSPSFGVI